MIDKDDELSISEQCRLIEYSRSLVFKVAKGIKPHDLQVMNLIDELYTAHPTRGSRALSREITMTYGIHVGRTLVRRLMREMGIQAIYPKKLLTTPGTGHKIFHYLLRNLPITRVNQVWSTDITSSYGKGISYLAAVIDWYSRKVLSWKVSTTMDVQFCTAVLEEAIEKYGNPEIFNTDQGSQYTSNEFTSLLIEHVIRIIMDGKGRALDNIFAERLCRQ